VSFVVQKATLE
jgi:hypothetical protein